MRALYIAVLLAPLAPLAAQQKMPAIRPLPQPTAVAAESLGAVTSVRPLSNGSVFVNDVAKRRVLLFDSTLKTARVVADSTPSTANAYGGRIGGLIAYRGDSTLFVDPASSSMLVIDANGKIVRVMSVPRSQDAMFLSGVTGAPAFDASGRIVYRTMARPNFPPPSSNGRFTPPEFPDSAPLVRVDLATRKLDTAAWLKTQKIRMTVAQVPSGGMRVMSQIDPMPVADDWTTMSDGTIAIVRARDYHVDFIGKDGALTSSPKIPFEWQRLTDDDKTAYIDSVRTAMEKARAANAGAGGGNLTVSGAMPVGGVFIARAGPGGAGGPGAAPLSFVSPSELPDYRPPFRAGNAVHADLAGNVWVQTSLVKDFAGPIYDVIDRSGTLIDRVQLQPGRTILGFGPDDTVYLTFRDGTVSRLERAKVH